MARWIGAWLYASSLIALAVTAGHIHALIDAFPISHLSSYGPRIPAIAALQAQWLPHAPVILGAAVPVSILVAVLLWRSRLDAKHRPFALAALASLNFALCLFSCLSVLTSWFLLPRLANLA